jgi:urea transporter
LSKIFLVEGVFSGLLVFCGTLLCSRILAGSLVMGSVVATILGWIFGMPAIALNAGTAGYNAALTTTAMAYYFEPSWTLVVVGFFVVVLCGLFEAAFAVFFWDFM